MAEELSPELQRALLWTKFSAALTAAGLDPERYRGRLEEELERVEDQPFEVKQRVTEMVAREIIREARPPPPPPRPPPAAPPAPPERPEVIPLVMPEPRVTLRTDPKTGEIFPAPDDTSIAILIKVLPFPLEWFYASPTRQREEFRWPTLLMAIERALERPDALIPSWVFSVYPWILEFLRQLRDRLREAGAR